MRDRGRLDALAALSEIRNRTYWEMGERLSKARAIAKQQNARAFLQSLATDLNLAPSVLYRSLQFYHAYPHGLADNPSARALSWTAHRLLLPIKDEDQRAFYLQQAVAGSWSARALRRAIKSDLYGAEHKPDPSKQNHQLQRPSMSTHNYRAKVGRVIDGDTLTVEIDLGFRTTRTETLRLRGIDCPELRSPAGKRAKRFVSKALSSVKYVVIHTYKTDIYARYVADVFHDPVRTDKDEIFAHGKFLNQQILDHGLAQVMFWG